MLTATDPPIMQCISAWHCFMAITAVCCLCQCCICYQLLQYSHKQLNLKCVTNTFICFCLIIYRKSSCSRCLNVRHRTPLSLQMVTGRLASATRDCALTIEWLQRGATEHCRSEGGARLSSRSSNALNAPVSSEQVRFKQTS